MEDFWECLGSVDMLKYEDFLILMLLGEDLLMLLVELSEMELISCEVNLIDLIFENKKNKK